MNGIVVKEVGKDYSSKDGKRSVVLEEVSLKVRKGEFLGIIGPNGCGKSTLLKLIVGVEKPERGSISVFGKSPETVHFGYVPQHTYGSLYRWFTVAENVALANSKQEGWSLNRTMGKLAEFGISKHANAYPYQLSGGIRQLAAIARSTIGSDIFLLDEPTNSLDYQNKLLVEEAFVKLKNGENTAVIVSHDIESAVLLCDKIAVFSEKPAHVRAFLPIDLPGSRNSETRFSDAFCHYTRTIFELLG